MRMRSILALLIMAMSVAVIGCSHTNNLAKFNVNNATAYYRTFVTANAESAVHIEGLESNTATEVVAVVGGIITGGIEQNKVARAVNGDSIATSVGNGIRASTGDFLMIRPVASMAENPDLIIETELTKYKLVSSASGVRVVVEGNSRVIDRKTGGIVWEDQERHSIPISNTWLASVAPGAVAAGASIANAFQLMNLPEEQIRQLVDQAATQAGREIGETLRKDVAKLHNVD